MKNISFDQYQRYKNVAEIVESMRGTKRKLKILEVGANEHRNLEQFLPEDEIKYLDIELPEELQNHPDYILGDATEMEFSNGSFDVVVALDVYEHIPPSKRNRFISELNRVSSKLFVLTAPFKSEKVSEAEQRVNSIFKTLFNINFRWLDEHFENGLPEEEELEELLNSLGVYFQKISHGSLSIWETMMSIHFFAAQKSELLVYREEIDGFYNKHLYSKDYTSDSYRKIYVGCKDNEFSSLVLGRSNLSNELTAITDGDIRRLTDLQNVFFELYRARQDLRDPDDEKGSKLDKHQIFFDTGKGFNENESVIREHSLNTGETELSFIVNPNNQAVTSLRIDPSDFAGVYEFKNVSFYDDLNQRIDSYIVSGNYSYNIGAYYIFLEEDPFIIYDFELKHKVKIVEVELVKGSQSLEGLVIEFNKIINLKNETTTLLETDISNLKKLMIDKDQEIKHLQNTKSELYEIISGQEASIEEKKKENQTLAEDISQKDKQLKQCSQEINAIYQSKGWKALDFLRRIIDKK